MKNKIFAVLGIFAVVATAFLVFGSPGQGHWHARPQMQLGGGFIGGGGGIIYSALQVPLDPAGRTAALYHKVHSWGPSADLLVPFQADTLTEGTGQVVMTGRDTFKLSWIAYATQGIVPVIKLILVLNGEAQFTGPDSYDINGYLDLYLPAADGDMDGFPDPGTFPILTVPTFNSAKRVPIP